MNTITFARCDAADSPDAAGASLLEQLVSLRYEITAMAERDLARYRNGFPTGEACPGARNLAQYLALRRFDLRHLQEALAATGISSLGRCESRVVPTLDRIVELLGGERPGHSPTAASTLSFNSGRQQLIINTDRIFGPLSARRDTRIMVTLPAVFAGDYPMIRELMQKGMDCARINCAHDDPTVWEALIAHVRSAEQETGRRCRIMMDLGGHKLRTGPLMSIPAVVHVRVRRDRYGRTLAPATVMLESAATPTHARIAAADDDGNRRFRVPDELYRDFQGGDRLEFRDTRGKRRHFTLLVRNSQGRWLAECCNNAYLCRDTTLQHRRPGRDGSYSRLALWEFSEFPEVEVELRLNVGDYLFVSAEPVPGRPGNNRQTAVIACTHGEVLNRITTGQKAWFDDGKIGGTVEHAGPDGVLVRITEARPHGSLLRADKGINFPGADLGLSGLSAKDLVDLDFVVTHADIVGYSFVELLADMERLMSELTRRNAEDKPVIAKIETRRAVDNLPEIILGTIGRFPLGIMIARGDLAVELGGERLSEIQEEILWLCEAAHVPAIWATQVLESMTKKGVINRAELTDAAMSGRAECVMLNKGPYVLKSLRTLDDILARIRDHQYKKFSRYRALHW